MKVKRGKIWFRDAHIGSKKIKKSKKIISLKTRVRSAVGVGAPAVRAVFLSGPR